MAKKILIGVVGAAIVFVGVGFLLPSKIMVEHSSVINAPSSAVFAQVNSMEKSLAWDPWAASDPTMKVKLGPVKAGMGASKSWVSENSGKGSQTITESIPNKSVKFDLDFREQGKGKAWFTLQETSGGTKLTQGFSSENKNIIARYFGVLMVKGLIKEKFIQGQAKIKELAEAGKK